MDDELFKKKERIATYIFMPIFIIFNFLVVVIGSTFFANISTDALFAIGFCLNALIVYPIIIKTVVKKVPKSYWIRYYALYGSGVFFIAFLGFGMLIAKRR